MTYARIISFKSLQYCPSQIEDNSKILMTAKEICSDVVKVVKVWVIPQFIDPVPHTCRASLPLALS